MAVFYTGKPTVIMIIHELGDQITFIDEGGNRYVVTREEFRANYTAAGEPDDLAFWENLKEAALSQGAKEVSAPEISGDATAPESDTTV